MANITGTSGNDTITGTSQDDTIYGGAGDDALYGGNGRDALYGGDGNDTISGGAKSDSLFGGAGTDTLDYSVLKNGTSGVNVNLATNTGSNGDVISGFENVTGTARADSLTGDSGANVLDGQGGNDHLSGGADNDTLYGGTGNDSLLGEDGNDVLNGGAGADSLDGGTGTDTADYTGSSAAVSVSLATGSGIGGDAQGDTLTGIENLMGSSLADTLTGDTGANILWGAADNDLLYGSSGNDSLYGGDGADTLNGGNNNDTLYGDLGNDSLAGDAGNDALFGGDGNDSLYGGTGADQLYGGLGDDTVYGGAGGDVFGVEAGNDVLFGGDDQDAFTGGLGDSVDGGEGGTDYDTLDLTAWGWSLTNILYDPLNPENGVVQFLDATGAVIGSMNFTNVEKVLACFTPGTMILTDRGEVAVEDLRAGDLVETLDHGPQPLRWVGKRALSIADLIVQPALQPVRIAAGALGCGLPERDMLVSPQHRMVVDGVRAEMLFGAAEVLVAATHLTALPDVEQVLPYGVTYIHLLFDCHELVQADGAWSESFQPADLTLANMGCGQRGEIEALFPELSQGVISFPAARLTLKSYEARVLLEA